MSLTEETPFKISVGDAALSLLKSKLALATFPDELEDAGHDYGTPLADIKRLVERWKTGYDWRSHEAQLNEALPQFTRTVDLGDEFGSIDIHYVHQKSEVKKAIPLLFVHGWPGNFLEVAKILPLLVKPDSPDQPAFHVVAPSLPGYGFSEYPRKKAFTLQYYAEAFNKLMLSLGYNEYVTQGGDLGHYVTRKIAFMYGNKHIKAWHTNFPQGLPPSVFRNPLLYISHATTPYSKHELAGMDRGKWFETEGRGYFYEQSTKPQTLGYSLDDSPVGLLAWIYEKLVNWSDNYPWDDDEVLTWISLYWFSRAGPTASLRIYYEITKHGGRNVSLTEVPSIPHGVAFFPKELRRHPLSWIRTVTNVVFSVEHDAGGHFAAHERPELLVGDLRKMFSKGGPAFGVVSGEIGYD